MSSRAARLARASCHSIAVNVAASAEVAAQHQRGRAAVRNSLGAGRLREIRRGDRAHAPAHCSCRLRETPSATPRPARRRRCRSSSGRARPRPRHAGAMATERISASPAAMPRQDEADQGSADHGAVGDDVALDQQPVNFILAPAALERRAMHGGDRRGIRRPRLDERRRGAAEQAGDETHHRRGSWAAFCGCASGARRYCGFGGACASGSDGADLRDPGNVGRVARIDDHRRRRALSGKRVGDSLRGDADDARRGARMPRAPLRSTARAAARSACGRPARRSADRRAHAAHRWRRPPALSVVGARYGAA